MPAISPFLLLPPELRDQIYEYVSMSSGAYLLPTSNGEVTSPSSLLLVCRAVSAEYKHVLQSTAPVITARVCDFDFGHVVAFLDGLLSKQQTPLAHSTYTSSPHPPLYRRLDLVLSLTIGCRQNLDKLETWLHRRDSQPEDHYSTSFTTTYAIDESSGAAGSTSSIGPITIMRIIDEVHHEWYLRSPAVPRRDEIGKVCDSLGAAELRINHRRTNGLRMGGLEAF